MKIISWLKKQNKREKSIQLKKIDADISCYFLFKEKEIKVLPYQFFQLQAL